jgi:transcription antitermination factor NusA-like protein
VIIKIFSWNKHIFLSSTWKEVRTMNQEQVTIIRDLADKNGGEGIKIIEWNVSDPTESLYAVVTPVKIK